MNIDWKKRVTNYYEKTLWDYILVYFRGGNYSMNYGYWDKTVTSRKDAHARLYERIAGALSIRPGDRVLDAGCGLGEAACFMAKTYGCQVTGVTISPTQVSKAQEIVRGRNLGDRVSVVLADYTKTNLPDGSFDAIYAIETICHLQNKSDFYKEAYRLLSPGGRLAVAEYIQKEDPHTPFEHYAMKTFLDGWVIANIWTWNAHRTALARWNYKDIRMEDYSTATDAVARYLYRYSLFGIPIYQLLQQVGMIDDVRMKDALSCRYQWLTKKRGLWGHALITARKP